VSAAQLPDPGLALQSEAGLLLRPCLALADAAYQVTEEAARSCTDMQQI